MFCGLSLLPLGQWTKGHWEHIMGSTIGWFGPYIYGNFPIIHGCLGSLNAIFLGKSPTYMYYNYSILPASWTIHKPNKWSDIWMNNISVRYMEKNEKDIILIEPLNESCSMCQCKSIWDHTSLMFWYSSEIWPWQELLPGFFKELLIKVVVLVSRSIPTHRLSSDYHLNIACFTGRKTWWNFECLLLWTRTLRKDQDKEWLR